MAALLDLVRAGWTLHIEPVGFDSDCFVGSLESVTGARFVRASGKLDSVIEQLIEGSRPPTPPRKTTSR